MSVFESNQKIGIELECYCSDGDDGARDWLESHEYTDKIESCSDGSLSENGAEFKFNGGIELRNSQSYLDIMYEISNDVHSLDTKFNMSADDNSIFFGNTEYTDFSHRGETGLHVHFGLPENLIALDIVRLIKNVNSNLKEVQHKGWRINDRWAKGTRVHVPIIHNSIVQAITGNDVNPTATSHCGDKYIGLNFCNVYGRHTVEFRFAHASIMKDQSAFVNYLELLKGLFDESITGESTMKWGDFRLHEIGGTQRERKIDITGIKSDSVIGKLRYCI